MLDDPLARLRQQAARSTPPVRAAAMLRIARAQTVLDPGQARITFEMALEETRRLSGRDHDYLFEQARLVAAAVAPDLLEAIPSNSQVPHEQFTSQMLVRIMLDHGHVDVVLGYVIRQKDPSTFPFGYAANLMHRLKDQERRLQVLRHAIEVWRAGREDGFLGLFQAQWKVLPEEEARKVVREIVQVTLEQLDWPMNATYDEGNIRIGSVRENNLFRLWHVLRHLDQELADSLIADHEQLATAVLRLPMGMESMIEESEERRKKMSGESGGFILSGNPGDRDYVMALIQASKDGDFGPPLEHAVAHYQDDTAPDRPNEAPKEFWPSTCSFRSIFYSAGKRLGKEAEGYLNRIPDDDLRLFAEIELAAALAGLPELPGTQRQSRSPK